MDAHVRYRKNNYVFKIPKLVQERTNSYLEMSYNILQWFKDNYELTDNMSDICKMMNLYDDFTKSNYYLVLTKTEKRKYNKSFFSEFISSNPFFSNYYKKRHNNITNCVIKWKRIDMNDDSDD